MPLDPHVSVITASFNSAKFLSACLQSVSRKGSKESFLEHIVCDGGSIDPTTEILSRHPEVRWVSEPDRGQADAFNKGVAMAKGEWVCWLNADDMLAPGAVAAFAETLARHPQAQVIYGHVQFVDEDSQPVKRSYHLPFHYPLILNGCYVPPSSGTFFRKDLLLQEPLDPDYHYVMDVEWFLRCGRNLRAVCVNQVLSHFRISSDAKTSEMIRSGRITERHAAERETYRRKYIYSQWPQLTEAQARHRFEKRQRIYRLLYYTLKMRYAFRYLRARVAGGAEH
jgi:glycosyltransferase involved in cell wall biosynthesis